jgi:hypothetical protein
MGEREVKKQEAGGKRWQWWTESEAQQRLKEWRASGKPLSTFARERGLSESRLRWWQKRMGERSGPLARVSSPASSPLAEARLVPAVVLGLEEERPAALASITVHAPGGIVVEVRDTALVPAEWVASVVTCLRRATP